MAVTKDCSKCGFQSPEAALRCDSCGLDFTSANQRASPWASHSATSGQGSTRSIDDVVPDDDTRIAVRSGNVARAPVNGAKMPNRCVVCNAPARGFKMRRTFYWHPPEVYFALLLCGLPYVIFALIMRKRATIAFGVCKKHRARRHNGILVGFGGGLLGFAMVCSGSLPLVVMGAFMLLILPISGALLARTIHAARIDEKWVWLRVGRPFLESLPRGPGSF